MPVRASGFEGMLREEGGKVVHSMEEADFVLFTGGSDINPEFYGEHNHPTTRWDPRRDQKDVRAWSIAKKLGLPMVGVCRGAQFLNVMMGGSLYQNVDNHTRDHLMVNLKTGGVLPTTSTHHQMMRPTPAGEVLAVASESTLYEGMTGSTIAQYVPDARGEDVEVVWYKGTQSLCFQGHPEYCSQGHPCREYFINLIKEYVLCAD